MNNSASNRRNFLKFSATGMAIASTSSVSLAASPETVSERQKMDVTSEVDVLVVGGGTAGTIAAIQAARSGSKTLLVERYSQLGGAMTTGGVAFPGLFDAWGKQVIGGVGWELVKESVELDGGKLPDFGKVPQKHWMNQVHINLFLYSLLAEEKCQQAGVEICYYEFPQAVQKTNNGWDVEIVGFGTKRKVKCKQVIDCTGGAEVVGLMGYDRMREDETQPGSYLFQIGASHNPASKQMQRLYVHGADSTNSRTVTEANLTGRKSILARVRKTKKKLMHMQTETAFRESYRIVGETVISVNDYTSGKVFDDAVGYAFYPVDLHTKTGVKPKPLKPGVVPTIPLGALIPKNSHHVMVAGRSISSDRLANSGLRVQASCMAMAQASGVTAALAAKQNTSPLKISLDEIRQEITSHKGIVPKV